MICTRRKQRAYKTEAIKKERGIERASACVDYVGWGVRVHNIMCPSIQRKVKHYNHPLELQLIRSSNPGLKRDRKQRAARSQDAS